ncbi:hypothetical protein fugu_009686 [Takifugu bimaculatus]|uniref:C-type lectin domain-containing protein n=1 Tax=Takifugu bimaculatus TaxID=433685 RepID=A0A4Z2CDB9_9TELE|nr:hypothetical protein fugu_009686 [Takifugu bimaculatus]
MLENRVTQIKVVHKQQPTLLKDLQPDLRTYKVSNKSPEGELQSVFSTDHCNSLGAHLASVSSPREYSFLQQMTKTASQSTAWLGGFYLQGRWLWINNEGFYYTNWYSQASSVSNPCMFLYSTYGWSNTACTSSRRFICSKSPFAC